MNFSKCKYCGCEVLQMRTGSRWMDNDGKYQCAVGGSESASKTHAA